MWLIYAAFAVVYGQHAAAVFVVHVDPYEHVFQRFRRSSNLVRLRHGNQSVWFFAVWPFSVCFATVGMSRQVSHGKRTSFVGYKVPNDIKALPAALERAVSCGARASERCAHILVVKGKDRV